MGCNFPTFRYCLIYSGTVTLTENKRNDMDPNKKYEEHQKERIYQGISSLFF